MIVYRYLKSHALQTVKESRLKASRLSDFNDPFEGMFGMPEALPVKEAKQHIVTEFKHKGIQYSPRLTGLKPNLSLLARDYANSYPEKRRQTLVDWNKAKNDYLLVVCFSSSEVPPRDEVLIWSHYADHHRGIRLGFEIKPSETKWYSLDAVDYKDERVIIKLIDHQKETGEKMLQAYRRKNSSWSYEAEYRLLIHPRRCEQSESEGKQMSFFRYPTTWLKSIDFGAECPPSVVNSMIHYAQNSGLRIEMRKARYHESQFALIYDPMTV